MKLKTNPQPRLWRTILLAVTLFSSPPLLANNPPPPSAPAHPPGEPAAMPLPAGDFFTPDTVTLLQSIHTGDEARARAILATGQSLNIQGKGGLTPLMWLVMNHDKAGAQLALKLGASPNFRDGHGDPAINDVAAAAPADWLQLLLDAGADPNIPDHYSQPPLFRAIGSPRSQDKIKKIQMLVAHGANINQQDDTGTDSAHYAIHVKQFDAFCWLVDNGADLHSRDKNGTTLADSIHWQLLDDIRVFGNPRSTTLAGWAILRKHGINIKPLDVKNKKSPGTTRYPFHTLEEDWRYARSATWKDRTSPCYTGTTDTPPFQTDCCQEIR